MAWWYSLQFIIFWSHYLIPTSFTSLFNLYNLLDNAYCRFYVFMRALNLAVSGKVTEHVIPSFKKIDSFLKEWNLEVQDQRELFLSVANALKDSKRYDRKRFHKWKWTYLFIYSSSIVHFSSLVVFRKCVTFLLFFQLCKGFFQILDQVFSNFLRRGHI